MINSPIQIKNMAEDRLTTLYNWSEEMAEAGEAVKDKVSMKIYSIVVVLLFCQPSLSI